MRLRAAADCQIVVDRYHARNVTGDVLSQLAGRLVYHRPREGDLTMKRYQGNDGAFQRVGSVQGAPHVALKIAVHRVRLGLVLGA